MRTEEELRVVTGTIFNIQHYCIHDGPGIRTNVFVKGCPLRCVWCANPESQVSRPQLMYRTDKCMGCGVCIEACPKQAVLFTEEGKVRTDRSACDGCGACVSACKADARERMGYHATAGEVFDEVAGDSLFYGEDGGVTITGGEALAHPEFTRALLELCRMHGIGTAVETCGFAAWEVMKPILELCDVVLYDEKHMDNELHRKYMGQGNERILENLKKINDELTCDIWVRVPTVPGYNDSVENIMAVGRFVSEQVPRCKQVHLLPFHHMGESKFEQLENEPNGFHSEVPTEEHMEALRDMIRGFGLECK